MKTLKTKLLLTFFISGFFLFGLAEITKAATYYVPTAKTTVDGDIFCDGKCTSGDTIIIRGGARGNLRFQDFNGAGSYITITNENKNPDSRVVIDGDGAVGWGVLTLHNCKYVDLRGNNDVDLQYGIKVINEVSPKAGAVWATGKSNHIKIGYLEITGESPATHSGVGIFVQDSLESSSWIWDTFEIHHNYIHDIGYAGMYLGRDDPPGEDNPYTARFSIHDNILEDMGAYGITYKGINGPNNYIYNNVVKRTGLVPGDLKESAFHGIGVQMTYGGNYVEIYNNWVEKTGGAGFKIGGKNHLIHDNIIVGCGTRNDPMWGHGIVTHTNTINNEIYDNIIIQAFGYGIANAYGDTTASLKRNLIGDCALGEFEGGQGFIEGIGADANWYEANVADFNFNVWSDDNNYSNDDFTFGAIPTCQSLGYQCCNSCQSGSHSEYNGNCPGQVCCEVCTPGAIIPPTCSDSGTCCPAGWICDGGSGENLPGCSNVCCIGGTCVPAPAASVCQNEGYKCCASCKLEPQPEYDESCASGVCCAICTPAAIPPLGEVGVKNPTKTADFAQIVENTIIWALSIIGSLALLMLIIGGVMYMGSTGDEQKVLTAKKIVTYAIIGLILILLSYSIIVALSGILS